MPEETLSRSSSSSSVDFLAGISEDAVASRPSTTPESEIKISVDGLPVPLKLAVDAGPGCGGIAWPAGEVLTKYMSWRHSNDRDYLRDKTVLELGSGTGLVGLAVGLLEPKSKVWITDQKPLLELMQRNVDLNFSHHIGSGEDRNGTSKCPVNVAELDWGGELPSDIPHEPEIILAADCVYFEPAFPLLVDTLCRLAPIGATREIFFCWKKRRKADRLFFKMLSKHFSTTPVDDDRPGEREKYERQGVKLLRLVRTK